MKFLLEKAGEESAATGFCRGNFFSAVFAIAPLACWNRSLDLADVLATTSPRGFMADLAFNWTTHVISFGFVEVNESYLKKNIPRGVLAGKMLDPLDPHALGCSHSLTMSVKACAWVER